MGYLYPGTTPVMIKFDIRLHGVPVVVPTNDREIPGSTPGRFNLHIKITSNSSLLSFVLLFTQQEWHNPAVLLEASQRKRGSLFLHHNMEVRFNRNDLFTVCVRVIPRDTGKD